MGIAKYVRETWKKPKSGMPMLHRRDRMASWRKDPVFQRVQRPTRIDSKKARLQGQTRSCHRQDQSEERRTQKGKIHMKRKPSKAGIKKITMAKSIQRIAEERVSRRYPNLEVLELILGRRGREEQVLRSNPA